MNYITEIKEFYDWLETNRLSTSAISLWHALMYIANNTRWKDSFSVAISTLREKTGCSRDAIYDARNQLRQCGRIDFKERKGNQSTVYRLIPFASPAAMQFPAQPSTQCPTQHPAQSPTNHKRREKETKQDQERTEKTAFADLFAGYTQSAELAEALDAYVEMRIAKGKAPTQRAMRMVLTSLDKFSDGISAADRYKIQCLDVATRNNWTDVYPLKEFADDVQPVQPVVLTPEMDVLRVDVDENTTIDDLI